MCGGRKLFSQHWMILAAVGELSKGKAANWEDGMPDGWLPKAFGFIPPLHYGTKARWPFRNEAHKEMDDV